MSKHITKTEMKSYVDRWDAVNKKEIELLQKTPFAMKFFQFLSLTASMHLFGVYVSKTKENKIAYQRWQVIRRKMKCD